MHCDNCGEDHLPDNGELPPNTNIVRITVKPEFEEQAMELDMSMFSVDLNDRSNIRVFNGDRDVTDWFDVPNQPAPEPDIPTVERPGPFAHSDLRAIGALNDVEWSDGGFFSRVPDEDREWLDMESMNFDQDDNVIVRSVTGEVVRIRKDDARAATALFSELSDRFSWTDVLLLLRIAMALQSNNRAQREFLLSSIDPGGVQKLANVIADLRPRAEADIVLQFSKTQNN